jgi:hypothetical protein
LALPGHILWRSEVNTADVGQGASGRAQVILGQALFEAHKVEDVAVGTAAEAVENLAP